MNVAGLLFADGVRCHVQTISVQNVRGGDTGQRWPVMVCIAGGRRGRRFPEGKPVACCLWSLN